MKMVEPKAMIVDNIDGAGILAKIEAAARTCYQSFDKAIEGSAAELVRNCIKRGHESVLEHVSVSVKFVTDRAIHNELVRHRLTSVSCESTRYCRYEDGITVIAPRFLVDDDKTIRTMCDGLYIADYDSMYHAWKTAMVEAEKSYKCLIEKGAKPQDARAVLPLSLKCEYVVTANLREWRHIFDLRCRSAAHPEMRRVMIPLLQEFYGLIPVVFDDLFDEIIGNGQIEQNTAKKHIEPTDRGEDDINKHESKPKRKYDPIEQFSINLKFEEFIHKFAQEIFGE